MMIDMAKGINFSLQASPTGGKEGSTKLTFVKGVDVSAVGLGSNPGKTILNGDRDTSIQV